LREENNEDAIKLIYEGFFVFAGMWAYGASLDEDKIQFSNTWKGLSGKQFKYEGLFSNLVVPTADTTRQSFLLDMHVA